ncbi:hypothetical protein BFP78_02580 [Gaetbulibacter sp. 5U11]|mgnify:CR=1 FL=1|nr:hypothetical protein BFP78_02580 [Gaetbulibacter sp. 5U11]
MNLQNLGVQEMNANEIKETDGGFLGILIGIGVILLCTSSCSPALPGCGAAQAVTDEMAQP